MDLNIPGLEELEPAAVVTVLMRTDGSVEVLSNDDIPVIIGLLELGKTILTASYLDENSIGETDDD